MKGYIGLENGRLVNPFDPPEDIWQDVFGCAGALSKVTRYNGNTTAFYSVAQHSVLLSEAVPSHLVRAALIHDMPEWLIGDLPRPVKELFPEFKELEKELQKKVFKFFGVPQEHIDELEPYDLAICVDEMEQLMPKVPAEFRPQCPPLGVEIVSWSPDLARMNFMNRYKEVFNVH